MLMNCWSVTVSGMLADELVCQLCVERNWSRDVVFKIKNDLDRRRLFSSGRNLGGSTAGGHKIF